MKIELVKGEHMNLAGRWVSRRAVLGGLGALAGQSLLSGCNGSFNTASGGSTGSQPAPSGPMTQGTISVGSSSGFSIGAEFAGLSYEKAALSSGSVFTGGNTNMIGMFKRLGTSLLRIGGNSVDQTVWNPTGAGKTAGQVAPPDVDKLAAFLQATGWKVLYGINLGGSATGATNTTLAAEEVTYAVNKLGSSLYGIEIGNEPDLYGGNPGNYYVGNWSLSDFEALWESYRAAILASSPNVVITGPAAASSARTWTVPFGEYANATQPQIALLTQHYYRGNGQGVPPPTAANLVSPDTSLPLVCGAMLQGARSITIPAPWLPWRMAETNSYYNGGAAGVSNSFAASLWVIDHMATIALSGATGVNMHGGGGSTGYSLNGDNSYTPIVDNNGVVVEASPEFYGMLLFTMLGEGAMLTTTVSAGGLNVTAYTVAVSGGGLNIIIVNKDLTQNVQASIDCGQNVSSATLLEMTAPSLTATSGVTIQGATVGVDGSFAPGAGYTAPQVSGQTVSCYVPALSAVLLRVM